MDINEIKILTKRMKSAWPSIFAESDIDRIELYSDCFRPFPFREAQSVVNRLINDLSRYPSIAELKEALRPIAHSKGIARDCSACKNSGWIMIEDIGHGSYKKCNCGNPRENFLEAEKNRRLGLTSEGKPIASPEEKRQACIRGFLRYKPEASQKEIEMHLERMGCKSEPILVGSPVAQEYEEPF